MQPDYLLMADELSELQIQSLGLALETLEEDLIELLAATEEGAKPVDLRTNKGRLSRMDEMHNQSILLANRTLTEIRLRESLATIENKIVATASGVWKILKLSGAGPGG